MKWALLLLVCVAAASAPGSLGGQLAAAEDDIFLSCQVTQIAATAGEGKTDARLRKINAFIEKDESLKKYKGFRFVSKKTVHATKAKSGSLKLKNKMMFSIKPVSVFRAQRKNTLTVDVSLKENSGEKKFIDREFLLLTAGQLDKKSDLLLAVTCPVFP